MASPHNLKRHCDNRNAHFHQDQLQMAKMLHFWLLQFSGDGDMQRVRGDGRVV
jgi:hypothetical protein